MYPTDLNWWAMETLLRYWEGLVLLVWLVVAVLVVLWIRDYFKP